VAAASRSPWFLFATRWRKAHPDIFKLALQILETAG